MKHVAMHPHGEAKMVKIRVRTLKEIAKALNLKSEKFHESYTGWIKPIEGLEFDTHIVSHGDAHLKGSFYLEEHEYEILEEL